MKKIFFFVALTTMLSSFFLLSCEENSENLSTTKTTSQIMLKAAEEPAEKTFYIYFNNGEWGRKSKECKGFGYCSATSCWFCCVDANENIVSCKDNKEVAGGQIAIIDPSSGNGYIHIKLDPAKTDEADAIANKSVFYIDEDINVDNKLIVKKGEYTFDDNIGKDGGYKLDVIEL